IATTTLLALADTPAFLRILLSVGAATSAFWIMASLAASWWVYDLAQAQGPEWIQPFFAAPPRRWVNIHAGLDQTSAGLRGVFPPDWCAALDIYDASSMTEPAIARARRTQGGGGEAARIDRLPVGSASCDAVFLFFAAHEVRRRDEREMLFRELRR